ncbi:hypothetical protein [Phytoactinopolyspora endophytica]|uniref:hypothetical protein n=1 Tax=Phytoactinopolyspora endophytica TaxID=1642495 RepID=UPI0013EB1007|nr:hypothetical protein [Phytoactinopolyspora endophytica]
MDVAPDGTLYIADESNERLRTVGADGVIDTVTDDTVVGELGADGWRLRETALVT